MAYEEVKLTRRDMARAEIESAINLLLIGDYVSAHVLAFAGKAILRGVAKSRGIETLEGEFELYIKEEHLKEWRASINDAYNVFKHAKEDPERELDKFRPETTVVAIFTALINYGLVYKQWSLPMVIFRAWFFSRHPTFAKPPFDETVQVWKGGFDHPEGKPLADALVQLREMISLVNERPDVVYERLLPEAKKNIER